MWHEKQDSVQNAEELAIKALKFELHYCKLRRELICLENNCLRQKLRMNAKTRRELKQKIRDLKLKIETWQQPKFDWQYLAIKPHQ